MHMIDNLGGRLGCFDRLEKELAAGARWSTFDRALGGRRTSPGATCLAARGRPRPRSPRRRPAGGDSGRRTGTHAFDERDERIRAP